ncbi:MAG: ABC transporter substrate-binding protein [Gammaproteobacteria bacterium]|nr:ABC transporter substrate-binding protein [Gammaproteobacteria bacterium]
MCRCSGAALALLSALCLPATAAERVLLVLSDGVPASLNADGPAGNHGPTQTGLVNLFETLVGYAPGGENEEGVRLLDYERFEGRLAESWEFDVDTLTWTFHLRKDVTSCAGNPLTADDVLYSFARAKSLSGAAPVGWFLGNVASVDGFTSALFSDAARSSGARELGDEVRKLDRYTVQIRQSAPNRLFLPALTIYGLAIYDSREMLARATGEDPWSHDYTARRDGPGFGPWCVERWRKEEYFIVRANPDYYRGRPYFDRIIMRNVPQSANRVGILRTGTAQLVEHLSPKEYAFLDARDEVETAGGYLNASVMLMANWRTPPFDDERVRQAMAHAVPYRQLADTAFFGHARQYHGIVPSRYPGYAVPEERYDYDPDKARRLLAEAGHPGGQGLERYAEAFRLSYAINREAILGPVATKLRTALRAVGFPVELDPLPDVQLSDRQLVKKDLPLSLYDGLTPIGVDAAYAILLSYITPPAGINNMTNFSDQRVDDLFAEALVEPDVERRDGLLGEAQQILYRRLAAHPLLEIRTRWAFRPGLTGLTLHPTRAVLWYPLRMQDGA